MVRFTDAKYKRKTRVRNTDTGVIRLYVGTNNREVADIVQKKKKVRKIIEKKFFI